jgi:hypothetical protein
MLKIFDKTGLFQLLVISLMKNLISHICAKRACSLDKGLGAKLGYFGREDLGHLVLIKLKYQMFVFFNEFDRHIVYQI